MYSAALPYRATTVPLRVVVVLGPAFGGFRIAFRAGLFGLDWPAGFEILEAAVLRHLRRFASISPERRARLREEPLPPLLDPELSARAGVVDGMIASEEAGGTLVVMRASFPFRLWPFGGWAVFEAGRIGSDGRLALVSHEELQRYW